MNKVIIVAGPTASGKTDLAIKLATKLDGEIINADSRQIYKHLDIGTNKGNLLPTNEFVELDNKTVNAVDIENSGVLGWLFSFLEPNQVYSVANFYRDALELIDMLVALDKTPIIVGGTGLYIDALVKGYEVSDVTPNLKLRAELAQFSALELLNKLTDLDVERAAELNQSDQGNPHRLIRAIEVATYRSASINSGKTKPEVESKILYPTFERADLFSKIDTRAAQMVKSGLVAETQKAIDLGFKDTAALQGIGYHSAQDFIAGKLNEAELIAQVAQEHRNYAKRQITWFEGKGRKYDLIKVDFSTDINKIIELCQN